MKPRKFNVFLNSKIGAFRKKITVDPDKSLSIRSFLIGSISQNISNAHNILESEDVKSTISACRKLGVQIKRVKPGSYKIFGKVWFAFAKKNTNLNCGNSTLARLIIGLSTTPNIQIKIYGDHSLNKRNMRINFLMSKFGASFLPKNKYSFPLKIISSNFPIGIKYKAGVSAQLSQL